MIFPIWRGLKGEYKLKKVIEKKDPLKLNILYSTAYQVLVLIIPLITAPYVSRVLGATNLGVYSYTQAFANYFVLFAMLGVANYGNRSIAQVRDNPKLLSKTFWEIYSFQICVTIAVSVIYLGYCFIAVSQNRMIYLLQFLYVVSAGFDINWFFFGIEKFKLTVTRNSIIKIANAVLIFVLVKERSDLPIYTLVMSLGTLVSVVVLFPFLIKYISFEKIEIKNVIKHIKPNLILFIPVIAISLYNIMDKLMLGYLSTADEVAFYSNAEKIAQLPNSVIMAVGNVLMPRMSNLIAIGNKEKSSELFDKSMTFMIVSSVLLAFGMASVSNVFAPWFYGKEFAKCGIYILWLCPTIIFKSIAGSVRTQLIIPMERDKVYIFSVSAGAIVNLIANYFFIPVYQGLGAVLGTVLAEAVVCFIQIFMTRDVVKYGKYIKYTLISCIFGEIMYIVLQKNCIQNAFLNIVVSMVVGVIIYGLLCGIYFIKFEGFSVKKIKNKVRR